MSNLLTVQDPDENASEVATATREKLQAWADRHLPSGQDNAIAALSDERIKELRAFGANGLAAAKTYLEGRGDWKPLNEFSALLVQLTRSLRDAEQNHKLTVNPREFSHAFEGAVREFHKQFFQAGMKWNEHAEYLAVLAMRVPYSTTGYQDRVWHSQTGTETPSYISNSLSRPMDENWAPRPDTMYKAFQQRFSNLDEWAMSQAGMLRLDDRRRFTGRMAQFTPSGTAVHYMDADGPWVAGFLNVDDECKFRFRRVRLGAYLTEHGMSDGDVRSRVEKAKQQVAGANFIAYPNDMEWEDQYTSGPHSCMADGAKEYETWDNLHPTSAYASSYHGCGDNGLVLLTSVDEDGTITGRGIMNVNLGTIVRWYGDPVAERVLKRSGVDVSNGDTFDDSWLALLKNSNGTRFIHPYVDGNNSYGNIDGDRVYIVGDGKICISDTGGSSIDGDVEFCIDDEEYHPADECYYQDISNNYVHQDPDSLWQCPVIREYFRSYDRTTMVLHGVSVEVGDHVYYNRNQYLTACGNGWTIDDDECREAFLEYHGIDEDLDDEEDEDEEAA